MPYAFSSEQVEEVPLTNSNRNQGLASFALDGDILSFWRTEVRPNQVDGPHWIKVYFGGTLADTRGLVLLPRQGFEYGNLVRKCQLRVATPGARSLSKLPSSISVHRNRQSFLAVLLPSTLRCAATSCLPIR